MNTTTALPFRVAARDLTVGMVLNEGTVAANELIPDTAGMRRITLAHGGGYVTSAGVIFDVIGTTP